MVYLRFRPPELTDAQLRESFWFSVLDESDATTSFWEQIKKTQPLHALGASTPNMFFLTRDRETFERVLQAVPTDVLR